MSRRDKVAVALRIIVIGYVPIIILVSVWNFFTDFPWWANVTAGLVIGRYGSKLTLYPLMERIKADAQS